MSDAHAKGRVAGALWLAVIVTSGLGAFAARGLYVANDPAATAARLLAGETQYRLAFVANVVAGVCYIGVTAILRDILKPVGRTLASLSAFFGITGSATGMAISIAPLVPLLLLKARYSTGFSPEQLRSLALAAFGVSSLGFILGMVFFGCQCVSVGYLIARSTFLPRALGVLLAVGGSIYVVGSVVTLVTPAAGARLFPVMMAAAFTGEGALCVWLLTRGVNRRNWEEYAGRADPHEELATA